MDKRQIIRYLSALHGTSGYEFRISDKIAALFSNGCDEVKTDALGNVIGIKRCGRKGAPMVMAEAHMDEIGLMITDIDDRGFLRFTSIGGIDARILPAKQVTVHGTRDIPGIIGAKPPHITSAAERSKAVPIKDLYIDTGYNKDEAEKIVSVGDTVTFCDKFCPLGDKFISTKSQDDRTSVAVLLFVMERLKKVKLNFDVCFCACVQEEVGRRGAKTAAFGIDPTFAIAVDVCHASTPDASADTFKSGSGTVVSVGPNIHPSLSKKAIEILDEKRIPYSIDVDGGDTGTDAWAIQVARSGIPTLLFSLPLRYMHTMAETVSIDDIDATADAIFEMLANIEDAEAAVCLD